MKTALRILAGREHSKAELRRKLRFRHIDESEIDRILTKLSELNYLDDSRFARLLVRERLLRRGRGFRDALKKLKEAGVEPEIIQQALSEARLEIDEVDLCRKAARKWLERRSEPKPSKRREKLARHLSGRGFSEESVRQVLQEGDGSFVDEDEA